MTINEVIERVSHEKSVPGRFPSRLIFVRNFNDYVTLANELTTVCDETIDISNYTKGDMLPKFKEMQKHLASLEGQQLLILSFGEYLRICIKRETDRQTSFFPDIWEKKQPESSTTKYIIPIFGGKELFDRIVPVQDERQQRYIWEINNANADSEYNLTIYSPEFAEAVTVDAESFQQWLENWAKLYASRERQCFALRTKLYHHAEPMYGGVNVHIVSEPFPYVVSLVSDGDKIEKEFASDEIWKSIANGVVKAQPLEHTIRRILNVGHWFDPVSVFARFGQMPKLEQDLILLWYKLNPANDYCTHALAGISSSADIPTSLRDAIFSLSNITDELIEQRASVLMVLEVSYGEDYFAKLDKIPSLEMRLKILTCKALTERAYAIKTISELFRMGADINAVTALAETRYAELSEYVQPSHLIADEVGLYFNWYRKSKIINRPNTDIPCVIDFGGFDSRNKVIQQSQTENSKLFWVDGLGAEWLPLLMHKLKTIDVEATTSATIAKCKLPSETNRNREWTDADEKWDALDKLAHNGMPDDKNYFSCIAQQFEIIGRVAGRVGELLRNYDRVILTGDHGSSRLAALSFHDALNFAIEPPPNAIVRSFGRYAELGDATYFPITESMEIVERENTRFAVLKTYEHFKQSGNAAGGNTDDNAVVGEVHGGMTPEEHLVPVVVIARKELLPKKASPSKPKGIDSKEMGLP